MGLMRTLCVTFSLAKSRAAHYQEHIKTETPALGKVRTHVAGMSGISFLTEKIVFMKMRSQRDRVSVVTCSFEKKRSKKSHVDFGKS